MNNDTNAKRTPERFHIRVTSVSGDTLSAYVADRGRTWDGGWHVRYASQAKTWKTEAGARRWLEARPDIRGEIEVHHG